MEVVPGNMEMSRDCAITSSTALILIAAIWTVLLVSWGIRCFVESVNNCVRHEFCIKLRSLRTAIIQKSTQSFIDGAPVEEIRWTERIRQYY